jgi:3-(3-hydroxy-phenyl)propionate hydroxylase
MRPAGRGPLESLYFDYPEFPAKAAPEAAGVRTRHPVAIVGAGPVGLTAALALAKHGIASVVIEKKSTFNDGSRATCIARQSFQIFEQIGAAAPFVEKSLGWRYGRSYYRGRQFYRLEMPHDADEKYLPMYNLQQQYCEQFLWQACAAQPLIDLRWRCEVAGLAQDASEVRLAIRSPAGDHGLSASYALAADGARSPVRSLMGLRLKGDNHEGRYVIADVRMEHDFPTERRALFDPASNPGATVLIHRQPENIWRIDYQLREGEDEEAALREENIRTRVGGILKEIGHHRSWELEWWSIYSANTLCLDDYRHGRVMFIGDSAHIVPIFGVRGLNNGFADAQNAAWKLAYVLKGLAGEALLDSYTPERRGATLDVFANASKSARFMTPPTRGYRLAREAALSLAEKHPFAGRLANPRQMQPHTYGESPLTAFREREAAFRTGPPRGAAARNVRMPDGSFLLEKAGNGFTGLWFGNAGSVDDLARRMTALDPDFKALTLPPSGRAAELYGAGDGVFYLLRPDLHVAGRWAALVEEEALATLGLCLGGGAP